MCPLKIVDTSFYPLLYFACTIPKSLTRHFIHYCISRVPSKSSTRHFLYSCISRVLSNSLTRYFASRIYPKTHHHAISLLACTLQFANSLFRFSRVLSNSPTLHFPSLIPHVISCFQFSTCFMISRYIRRRGVSPSLQSPCVTTGYAVLQPSRLIRHAHTAREHPFPPHSQSKRYSPHSQPECLFCQGPGLLDRPAFVPQNHVKS